MRKTSRPASKPAAGGDNRIRLISGRWRGRKLAFPDSAGLRPTGDRIRETLFNWLAPELPGAHCLDLFAGSGALGFEALSRGAAHCTMVESASVAVAQLRRNAELLAADNLTVINATAQTWLARASGGFDIVFIDPPFADTSLQAHTLVAELATHGLLRDQALVYIEQPRSSPPMPPAGFNVHRTLNAGQVCCALWRYRTA